MTAPNRAVTLDPGSGADAADLARALHDIARPNTTATWRELAPAILRRLANIRAASSSAHARVYRVGDSDPTPDGLDEHCEHPCIPDGVCTWSPGHTGQHVAGSGDNEIIGIAADGGSQ